MGLSHNQWTPAEEKCDNDCCGSKINQLHSQIHPTRRVNRLWGEQVRTSPAA